MERPDIDRIENHLDVTTPGPWVWNEDKQHIESTYYQDETVVIAKLSERDPEQMRIDDKENYDHCMGNMAGMTRQIMQVRGLIKP